MSYIVMKASLLSEESIQFIIDGLTDVTGSPEQLLTLSSSSADDLTEEQKATLEAKGWTIVDTGDGVPDEDEDEDEEDEE